MTSRAEVDRGFQLDLPAAPRWVRWAAALVRCLPRGRYRTMNWLGRNAESPFWMCLPPTTGSYAFCCDLRDAIAREVCFTGCYEPQETALVRAILRPGMTFLDVGANWGYFSLLAAYLVGTSGRVLSLEPDPRLFRLLQGNVARNALGQIIPLPLAAADRRGSLTLAGYDERGGNFGLSRLVCAPEGSSAFQVPGQPLDEVFREWHIATVDLLKMDIEGAEGFALAGLSGSLRRGVVKRLLLELHPKQLTEHGQSVGDVLARLRSFGYHAWSIDHSVRMTRRAAYTRNLKVRSLLRPFEPARELDCWPHLLWVRPDSEPLG